MREKVVEIIVDWASPLCEECVATHGGLDVDWEGANLDLATQILSAVIEEINNVENPYPSVDWGELPPNSEYNSLTCGQYMNLQDRYAPYEECKQAIIKSLERVA